MFCLDPAVIAMIARSIEAEGGESSYNEISTPPSHNRSFFGSQSPVRYSGQTFQDWNFTGVGFGSFVASTPERESNRLVVNLIRIIASFSFLNDMIKFVTNFGKFIV